MEALVEEARYDTEPSRPAAPSVVMSLALMREELSRRHLIILGCEKPSQAEAERELVTMTFLLQLVDRCTECGGRKA